MTNTSTSRDPFFFKLEFPFNCFFFNLVVRLVPKVAERGLENICRVQFCRNFGIVNPTFVTMDSLKYGNF